MSSNIWVVKIKHKDMDFEHFSVELLWLSVTMAIDRFVIPIISIFAAEDHGEKNDIPNSESSKFIKIHHKLVDLTLNPSQKYYIPQPVIPSLVENTWNSQADPQQLACVYPRISQSKGTDHQPTPAIPGIHPVKSEEPTPHIHPETRSSIQHHEIPPFSEGFLMVFYGFFQPLLQPFEAMNIPASRLHRHQ